MMLSRATRYVRMRVPKRSISFIDRFVESYSISPCSNSLFSVSLTALDPDREGLRETARRWTDSWHDRDDVFLGGCGPDGVCFRHTDHIAL